MLEVYLQYLVQDSQQFNLLVEPKVLVPVVYQVVLEEVLVIINRELEQEMFLPHVPLKEILAVLDLLLHQIMVRMEVVELVAQVMRDHPLVVAQAELEEFLQ
jgi:hypothetical protein